MLVSQKNQTLDRIFENLLKAHKILACKGNAFQIIILTRYLLKLLKKREDVLIDVVPEQD